MNHQRIKSRLLLAVVLVLGSAAAVAVAQDSDRPDGQDSQFNAWVAPFLKELNLTEKQEPKFLAIQKAMTAKWVELQKMPPQERKSKQEAFYKARFAELEELLSPEQMAKYREIRARRWQQQSRTPAADTTPRHERSRQSAPADYSGKDIQGIEKIVDEVQQASEPWRQQADARIDQLRKAQLEIRVVDADGNPLAGVPVHVKQQRHLFRFGGVVNGPLMNGGTSGQGPGYKEMFLGLGFNSAGFANYLKYRNRPRSWPHLPALFAWFHEHEIPVRGHCLMWPGGTWGNFLTDELGDLVYVPDPELERLIRQGKKPFLSAREPRASLTSEEAQLVRSICERMTGEASTKWPVFAWDVINETRDNHIIQDLVGKDAMVDWFKIARGNTKDRDALLYLNENRVISDPASGDVTDNMKRFEKEVQYLLENGAPLSALGFQSRFAKQISPETLYKRLEYFEKFNLPIAATEFEIKNTLGSEQAKAVMTEQAMTVLFSHKLVNGVYAWTIRAGGRAGDRAIVNSDGTLNLRGKVWMYLMKNRWWTDESLTTDASGTVKLRAFKGEYIVSVGDEGGVCSMELRLDENKKSEVTLRSVSPVPDSEHGD